MDEIKAAGEFIKWACGFVPLGFWQILGAMMLTFMIMAFVKMLEPCTWTPKKRRKTNTLLAIPLAGLLTIWLYDQKARDFVIVFVMFANAGLYSWLAHITEKKRDSEKWFWGLMYYLLRPYDKVECSSD